VNWDPKFHTAVSDLEVLNEEEQGSLWHFRYPVTGTEDFIVVATTRPETMLGDTAVAVSPSDERYTHLVGHTVTLPICNREIPIVADEYVDAEFGSGCVKITPAHDFNDYEVGKRHSLPMINIFDDSAALNDSVPAAYRGLDRFEARSKIVSEFEALGLLEKIEPHTLKVPRGDRSGAVIEPYLTDQWYVDAKQLAIPAIEAVENGQIEFVPKQWENTYFAWMRDIQDWCISRQLWWGHRIPAWYDSEGKVYVGADEHTVRLEYGLTADLELTQDNDVLDTWFSSALWTFSTLGWPEETPELSRYHPSSVLVTGFDIIFFWVARMIMMTLHFRKEVPFKTVYVHGLVRDAEGQKMSKSKGNVLDPIDLIDGIDLESLVSKRTSGMMQPKMAKSIEKATRKHFPDGIPAYGTDALRYTFYSLASTGRDIKFDLGRVEGYRNFCNKIWNASRYVLSQVEDTDLTGPLELGDAEQWIYDRLQTTLGQVDTNMAAYRFDHVAQNLYEFFWNDYCDWYLEFTKPVLWDEGASTERKRGVYHTLVTVLEAALRMLHPFMPFITEEIWQRVAPTIGLERESIMLCTYPEQSDFAPAPASVSSSINRIKTLITATRTLRSDMNLSPGQAIPAFLYSDTQEAQSAVRANEVLLKKLGKLTSLTWVETKDQLPPAASLIAGDTELFVPLEGLIDVDAELIRINKRVAQLQSEIDRVQAKLANPNFADRAPAEVVAKEREKLESNRAELSKTTLQQTQIEALK
jgi:valyl-tRNA synthetase